MEKCLKFRQGNGQTSVPLYLEEKVNLEEKSWPTARTLDGTVNESLETWTARYYRKKAQGINLQRPLPIAVMQDQKNWATPRAGKTTDENPETWLLRQAKGDVATMPLTAQVKSWATPTARDNKSGRGNADRDYKELTPQVERNQSGKLNPRWVETLMGLPIGWTMPSCMSPVIIEQTSCDCSATESSQPLPNSPSESCQKD